jgi:putative ABC transport system ATP-binding protein
MLAVRDATKSYRQGEAEVKALAGVTLDVAAGEFVAIVGPSGSGKSTLLHLMGGLDVPTSGDVLIDGASIARMSDDEVTVFRRRAIGFVFQFFNLLPTLSAEENVALPLLLDGKRPRDVRDRVAAALDAVGLGHRRGHRRTRCRRRDAARGDRTGPGDRARRSSSPTSRPATSTPRPASRSSSSSARRTTTAARRSSW